jgi:hypothetical protein
MRGLKFHVLSIHLKLSPDDLFPIFSLRFQLETGRKMRDRAWMVLHMGEIELHLTRFFSGCWICI